ncbi:hypothetical protein GS429_19785 [Natronorubrum sp. JWXQ-INN-674]|uniref:Uncharacterized protein n=1 Tax=Natronorubrum halalkaliphilum TaxID=2691917 RepID=A0A6B0VSB2_9EURY|nr:hypothetical protein [Natronorubrum halalkaliphilum]MXV64265.1 hypothetical protein [Natronorubrum halalkaliphilum]
MLSIVDVDGAALQVARTVYERQALALIETADTDEYGGLATEYDVVVTAERGTAAWEVSETGTTDRDPEE